MTERFVLALVGSPFGINGFVKVKSLSGEYEHLRRLNSVTLKIGNTERLWEIEDTLLIPKALAVKFRGINSPETAKTINGAELIADRASANPLEENEFYIEDLKGLAVITEKEEILGHITNIVEGGGGNLAEIRLISGELRYAPFRNEFFGTISLKNSNAILLCPWILE